MAWSVESAWSAGSSSRVRPRLGLFTALVISFGSIALGAFNSTASGARGTVAAPAKQSKPRPRITGRTVLHFKVDAGYTDCAMNKPVHPTPTDVWCGQQPRAADGMPALPAGTYKVEFRLLGGTQYDIKPARVRLTS